MTSENKLNLLALQKPRFRAYAEREEWQNSLRLTFDQTEHVQFLLGIKRFLLDLHFNANFISS